MKPLELLDIVGQDEAIGRLQRAMSGARFPHALLFAGPDGVGRRTTALGLGATFLCSNPVSRPNGNLISGLAEDFELRQACGVCDDCKMTASQTHPDLHMVYKELARYHDDPKVRARVMQELSIEVVRSFLIAPAYRAADRGRGKVFVVLEAELMRNPAQNALLKTLEEPPPGVTIILISEHPEQLLPTTLSRCAMVRFSPLPGRFVVKKLLEIGVSEDEAGFWARFTQGSVGCALHHTQQGMYEIKRELVEHLASLGSTSSAADAADWLIKLMEKLSGEQIKETKQQNDVALSKLLASRRAGGMILGLIASVYRDAVTLRTGAELELIHSDQGELVRTLTERFDAEQLAEILEQLSEYERLLWRNVNPKIIWDNVAITCESAASLRH